MCARQQKYFYLNMLCISIWFTTQKKNYMQSIKWNCLLPITGAKTLEMLKLIEWKSGGRRQYLRLQKENHFQNCFWVLFSPNWNELIFELYYWVKLFLKYSFCNSWKHLLLKWRQPFSKVTAGLGRFHPSFQWVEESENFSSKCLALAFSFTASLLYTLN